MLPFSDHFQFRVVRPFLYAGVDYERGDILPKGEFDRRMLVRLYEQLTIEPVPMDEGETPVITPPDPSNAISAEGLTVKHKGFGKFYLVNADGDNVAGPYEGREAGEAALAQLTTAH